MNFRIWRSPKSAFGVHGRRADDRAAETFTADAAYTDDELAAIAAAGFSAVWVHGQLHHLVRDPVFTEFAPRGEEHLEKLNNLIARAKRHQLELFLYMQPPRALPADDLEFWRRHADVAGEEEELPADDSTEPFRVRAICTSTEKVRDYLRRAFQSLTAQLPGLGGYIFITASEYPAHCWSRRGRVIDEAGHEHFAERTCPRCKDRRPEEVVVELLATIRAGVRAVAPALPIVCWNWSWRMYIDPPYREIVEHLPDDLIVMADFERGGYEERLGHLRHFVDEYSLSYAGPSELFRGIEEIAEAAGRPMMAKLQLGATHELASVVSLPLLGNIFKKADYLRRRSFAGFMGCWNFGNEQSANTAGFNFFLTPEAAAAEDEALEQFAARYFPGCRPELVRAAWQIFGRAMKHYPFDIPYLYMGPTNYAIGLIPHPAPLTGRSVGRSWLNDERGDTMDRCFGAFSFDESAQGFADLVPIWAEGVAQLRAGLEDVDTPAAAAEYGNAEVCLGCFASTDLFFRFTRLRRAWSDDLLPAYRELAAAELDNLRRLLPFIERDPRQGFHIEAHAHQFNADMIRQKIAELEQQLNAP